MTLTTAEVYVAATLLELELGRGGRRGEGATAAAEAARWC
jgi:hypothetical protein